MKKLVFPVLLLLAATISFGQWSPPSNSTNFITTQHNNRTNDFGLNLESSGGNYQYFIENNTGGSNRQVFYFGHANSAKDIFGVSTSSNSGSSWVPRFVITQNGTVGIGTTIPVNRLTIAGSEGNNPSLLIRNNSYNSTDTAGDVSLQFGFLNHLGPRIEASKYSSNTTGLKFYTEYGYNTPQLGLTIKPSSSGSRVGIGTATPDSKLTVKGNIHAEEVKVDLSVPGPDYVFKEGYNLMSLEEVQEYIRANGHLPNIPSAREMEENGVELGSMNMKLLEKIEELTLYVLDLKKEITELKSHNK